MTEADTAMAMGSTSTLLFNDARTHAPDTGACAAEAGSSTHSNDQ